MKISDNAPFIALHIAVLTVSDTRTLSNDTSGLYLVQALTTEGHQLAEHAIVKDDLYAIRAQVSVWIANPQINAILVTGGTGFAGRDSTPEAVGVLFDKHIDGFGELFRSISYQDISNSTIQSRALAGLANNTVVFCMPGSTGACQTAWQHIIRAQLNHSTRPCNFVPLLVDVATCTSRG